VEEQTPAGDERLTPDDRALLKRAAFGAVYLVSNSDLGFFAMLRESAAASDALTGSSGLVRDVLTTGALPKLPRKAPDLVEAQVIPELRESVRLLDAKAPDEVANYRRTVLDAVERVAGAVQGVKAEEAAMVAKVRDALGGPITDG
jgi:hypothetical protein